MLPGPTRTEGVEDLIETMAAKQGVSADQVAREFVRQSRPTSLLQRLASPEEVANMVVYTCSKEGSATNGAALRVEGGILRGVG